MHTKFLRLALLAVLLSLIAVPAAWAAVVVTNGAADGPGRQGRSDNRSTKLDVKKAALLENGLQAKLNGKAYGKTYEVARGQFVQLAREGEQSIWTVLGEFKDFSHNNMPQPDRSVDNTTIWAPDFSRQYYLDLLFNGAPGANSMRNFYIEQSSGRFAVNGDVTDWVKVPGKAAGYDDDLGGPAVWQFLIDSVDGWYQAQTDAGQTPAQINAYLSRFDVWDRYDYDGDGNFNEPDGYIDTFQSVHAGEGNEAGGGALGDSAIWSHSWYAYSALIGTAGPSFNKYGGIQIGNSDYWVGKYTIQPENGGVGVFTHEFGHDLGLPDLYDTSGGENGTGFWTLMSSGSWMGDGTVDIGSKSSHMGAWEKFQLGWLNYAVASAGQTSDIKVGPMETNTKQAQGVFVVLPKKTVTSHIADPHAGSNFYYSGSGDNLRNLMYKQFTLGQAPTTLTAQVNYGIEVGYDYAYVVVSKDGGANWENVPTNLSPDKPYGIDGFSDDWVELTADLSAYAGMTVQVGFQYVTDGGVAEVGFMIDDIAITGYPVDGAETGEVWTYKPATGGFRVTSGTETKLFSNYYVAEFKTYLGYDSTLKVGPYNFGFLDNPLLGNWVEHFPYQDGLLVNYWDTSQLDNNTSVHPGYGLVLPVDAHPKAMLRPDGGVWRNRVQTYDSTFGLEKTDALTLHFNSVASPQPSLPAVPVFNDLKSYYDEANPWGSVIVPKTGTEIRIVNYSALGNFMQVQVGPAE
jgi:immune inhibitor A